MVVINNLFASLYAMEYFDIAAKSPAFCTKMSIIRENLPSGVREQHSRRPACASVQSDQRLCLSLFLKVSYVNLLQMKFQFSS